MKLSTGRISTVESSENGLDSKKETSPLLGSITDTGERKKRKLSKRLMVVMVVVSLGNFLSANCTSLQGPFFPKEAELKGASPSQYGLVFAAFQLSVFISAPIYAKLLRYVPPRFLANAGIFALGSSSILFGLLNLAPAGRPFLSLAYCIRIFEGLASSAFSTASFSIIAAEFPETVATVFSSVETFFGIGLIVGPTLGGALYELGGYSLPFEVVGGLLLVLCIIGFIALPKDIGKTKNSQSSSLMKFWLHPSTIIHALAVTTCMVYIGYNSAILEPFLRQFNLSPMMVGLVFVIQGGVYAIISPLLGWLCDKLKISNLLCVVGCFFNCVYLLLVGPAPFLPLKTELWLVILSMVFFGLGVSGTLVPAVISVMNDALDRGFPNDLTTYGLVSSLLSSAIALGCFAGPSIGGYLEESVGYRKGTGILLGISLAMFVVMLLHLFWRMNATSGKFVLHQKEQDIVKK